MCDVVKFEEGGVCLDNFGGDKSLNCVHKNLCSSRYVSRLRDFLYTESTYLHQSLGIITGPLVEVAALFEPS